MKKCEVKIYKNHANVLHKINLYFITTGRNAMCNTPVQFMDANSHLLILLVIIYE